MKNKIIFKIIHLIASAQMHSDEGKVLRNKNNFSYYGLSQEKIAFKGYNCQYGYDGKDRAILAAIKIINSHPYMGINYYIKNNNDNVIIYFNFKIDNKRYQVSFHSYSQELKKLVDKGSPCRWENKISSRETCQILLKLCGKESKIKII